MEIKRELRAIWAINVKNWKIEFRYPLSVYFFMISPVLWLMPNIIMAHAINGSRYSDRLYDLTGTNDVWVWMSLGSIIYIFLIISLWSASYGIRREEFFGTFEAIYVSPASRYSLIAGNNLQSVTHSGVGLTIQMIFISIIYRDQFSITGLILAMLILLVTLFLVQNLAMIVCGVVLWQKEGYRIVFLMEALIGMITPVMFPLIILPEPLRTIARLNPLTYGVIGFRDAFLFGPSIEIFIYLAITFVCSIFAFFLGIKVFEKIEVKLREKAIIGKY